LTHLRQAAVAQSALIGAGLGLRHWGIRDGSRAMIRAALPFYVRERGITRFSAAYCTKSGCTKSGEFGMKSCLRAGFPPSLIVFFATP
jgi:hypothetical protein